MISESLWLNASVFLKEYDELRERLGRGHESVDLLI